MCNAASTDKKMKNNVVIGNREGYVLAEAHKHTQIYTQKHTPKTTTMSFSLKCNTKC